MMRKSALLIGCAAGALLAAPAAAQSFNGTPTVVTGAAVVTPGPNTTAITVSQAENVINWATVDVGGTGAVNFQPINTTATFQATPGIPDYTVLNRILPVDGSGLAVAATVSFNGTVNSVIVNNPGGHIWFYSPTGIIAGPNARFNVGSLILTTNDIAFVPNPAGGFGSIYGPGGLVDFNGPAGSTGFVRVANGAQITASGANAYVALVAPRVVQQGLVQANGQIAYVAAEQLDMTINGGLFDFTVTVGTTDPEGIVHTGVTTGPASTSAADLQRISMVALPKNAALTMLLAGSAGYTPAANVANEGSSVVLTAGFTNDTPSALPANRLGSIDIRDGTYSNDLTAWATSGITIAPDTGAITFGGEVAISAAETIQVEAQEREQITVAGDLTLNAGVSGTGGTVSLTGFTTLGQPGGLIDIAGDLLIGASSEGILSSAPPPDGQGGDVSILADGGTISAQGLFVDAYGFGQFDTEVGGNGTGGQVSVIATNDGTIAADFAGLNAYGAGGNSDFDGGDGTGGGVVLTAFDGALDFDFVSIDAGGQGGSGPNQHGNGFGGTAQILVTSRPQDWDELLVKVDATAGYDPEIGGGSSGNATASPSAILFDVGANGSLIVHGDVTLTANAYMSVDGVAGFTGRAGDIGLTVRDFGSLTVEGGLSAEASALFVNNVDISPNSSPNQFGGNVSIVANNGTMTLNNVDVAANADALSGVTAAGEATGGRVTFTAVDGGAISLSNTLGTARLALAANAYGSPGPLPGDAIGGVVAVNVDDGSISVAGNADLTADAMVGEFFAPPPDGDGFAAQGGTVAIDLDSESGTGAYFGAGNLFASAIGDSRFSLAVGTVLPGGDPIRGDGGDGTGGDVSLDILIGDVAANTLRLDSSGIGGASAATTGPASFQSGSGFGGVTRLRQFDGTLAVSTLELASNGQGGGSATAASGAQRAALAGSGNAGTVLLNLNGGNLTAFDIELSATGTGADGMDNNGTGDATDGGNGVGGTIQMLAPAGWTGNVSTTTLTVDARGTGGVGGLAAGAAATPPTGNTGDGGDGTGGSVVIELADGTFSLGTVRAEASGAGGYSGDASMGLPAGAEGGDGFGGEVRFALLDSPAGPVAARLVDSLFADAGATGGFGSTFVAQSYPGELFFEAEVLDATTPLAIQGDLSLVNSGSFLSPATGIDATISGSPLEVGGNIVMSTAGTLSIDAAEPLAAAGFVTLNGYSVTANGLIRSGGGMSVFGGFGIAADRLSSGGATVLQAFQGPIVVSDLTSIGSVIAVGQSVDIRSTGGLTFETADATAGDLFIETSDNLVAASPSATGTLTLQTTAGDITTGDLAAGSWLYVDAAGSAALGNLSAVIDAAATARGGNLSVGNVSAGDEIWLSVFGTNPARTLTAGNLTTTGTGNDAAVGPPVLFGGYPGGAGPTGHVTRVRSPGALTVGDVASPGRAILVSDLGTLTAGTLVADEALVLLARGDIAFAAATTDGAFHAADSAMFALLPDAYDPAALDGQAPVRTGGDVSATGAVRAGRVSVAAGGDAVLADVNSAATTFLSAGGAIDVARLVSTGAVTARGGSVDIASTGSLTFAEATAAAGNVTIATNGSLTLQTVTATSLADLNARGTLRTIGDVTATTIDLSATADIVADAGLLATGTLSADARGTFALAGQARGTAITVASGDIVLGTGARLGARGLTTDLTLLNSNVAAVMNIGGPSQTGITPQGIIPPQSGGYRLDQAEAARLFADNSLTFGLSGYRAEPGYGRIAVRALTLTFGATGNLGTGGQIEISTPAEIAITGNVALTTSGADDTLLIDPTLVELDSSTGSIALLGASGAPLGRIEIVGETIAVASTGALTQLRTLTDFAAINALLDTPGGSGVPLRAGTVAVTAANAFYVQNSGASTAFADRRGFASGALDITAGAPATRIAINGQILTAGGPVGGLATAPLIRINGAAPATGGRFDPASTINGCVIGGSCAVPPPDDRPVLPDPPNDSDLLQPVPRDTGPPSLFVAPIIELADSDPLVEPPLVDEPITGIGNDDLWEPPCPDTGEDGTCREADDQP